MNVHTRWGQPVDAVQRRIAVINSNSSEFVTEQLANTAASWLRAGTEADFINPERGPAGIDTKLDLAVAAVETAYLVHQFGDSYDAYVVACGNDPGLLAAREGTNRPVVGIAEAGFLQACALASRFSVAVLAPAKVNGMHSLVNGYGLQPRLAGVIAADSSSQRAAASPELLLEQLTMACLETDRPKLGGALVLTGSVMGQIADELSSAIGVPVISGLLAGIGLAETLATTPGISSQRTNLLEKGKK